MRVFVTGASGFIGSHLVMLLLQAECVVAILSSDGSSPLRLETVQSQAHIVQGRIGEIDKLRPFLETFQPEICFHLAWYAKPGEYLYSPLNLNSLTESIALLQLLIEVKCRRIIMVGTCAEYDTSFGYLREDTPTRPETIYAASKLSMSIVGQQIARDAGIDFVWARLFYLYGEMEDDRRMIPALIKSLLRKQRFKATPGEQVRDYLHVNDVAAGLWHLAKSDVTGIFNICSGNPITVRQVMELIGTYTGAGEYIVFGALPYRNWEPMFICGSNDKLRTTGWFPRHTLQEGLENTVEWWRTQPI